MGMLVEMLQQTQDGEQDISNTAINFTSLPSKPVSIRRFGSV
jgi:hypothetical protein